MLSEQNRSKLDGVVSQMTTNGESEESIRLVVEDFKTKYDTPAPAQNFVKDLFKPTQQSTTTSTPMMAQETENIDLGAVFDGAKKTVKAVPAIAENIKDTFTTRQGLSDLWNVTKNAGVEGVKNVVSNYNELFWGGAQKGLESLGFETLSGFAGKDKEVSKANAKKSSDEIRKFFYGDGEVVGYSDPNDTRGFLERISAEDGEKEVAKIIGSQLPTFASLLGITFLAKGANLPALPATYTTSVALGAGDAYQKGKDYYESRGVQMTPEEEAKVQKTSLMVGLTAGVLDTYGISRIMKPSQFVTFKNQFIKEATNAILDVGVDTVVEGGTEGLQEIIQNAYARAYNTNQNLFEGVPEAIFGGGVFGGGSSAIINSSGLLRTGVLERIKSGKTPEEVKAEVKAGAEASGATISDSEIDEAITDAKNVYDGMTEDIVAKLDSGKSIEEVALEVGQNAPVSIDNVVEFVQQVDENRTQPTPDVSKKAIDELNALSDKVDDKVLTKTAKDLQDDFERVQSYVDDQVKDLRNKVNDLRERLDSAEPRSTDKKRLKAQLENARTELREAEGSFFSKVEGNAKAFRTFITEYAKKQGVENPSAIADRVVARLTDETNITSNQTIEDLIKAEIGENKQIPTKNLRKKDITPEKEGEINKTYTNDTLVRMNKSPKDYIDYYNETHAYPSVKGLELFISSNPTEFSKKELIAEFRKKPTQKEKVKEVVEKKGKASIKEIADETGILEPNIRRILGVGAKEGEFERVADGVYTIKTADGKEVAVVIPADAVETLPKLASEGFKADMVFLDIPYDTPAVKGGNRGVKYSLLSVEDFSKILDATKTILRDENSPIIHMFSQAQSGIKAMQKYNDLFTDKGLIPIGKGEYQKTFADGSPVTSPNGKVAKPEGIIVFNQSGTFDKNLDLQFKMVRPKGYQTEKPAEMLAKMIKMTTNAGDTILDPFAGSGVTGAEAVKAGRKAVLIEKDKEVAEKVTKPRVESAVRSTPASAEEASQIYWNEVVQKRIDNKEAVVLGADNLKDFFGKDYNIDNHKMYSSATNMLYERAVKALPEKEVKLTVGGTGSGKSDFVVSHLEEGFAGVIYDSTGWNYEGLKKQISFATENGKEVEVYGIIPDIRRARAYTFKREANGEHPVTETAFVRTHVGSIKTMLSFIEDGGDVYVLDTRNITSKEEAENTEFIYNPIDTLKEVAYSEDNVKEQINNINKENFEEVISERKEGAGNIPRKNRTGTGLAKKEAFEEIRFYLEASEKGQRVFVPQKDSMDYKVAPVRSTFPQFVPENMRSRKTFDRLLPYWEKQERPSNKTPMLQALYDIFTKEVEKRTLEIENESKTTSKGDNLPFKKTSRDDGIDFVLRKYKSNVEYGVKQATNYLEDLKKRLAIDFDTVWIEAIVADYSVDPIRGLKTPNEFAEGVMSDNTIALKKKLDAYTAEHESIHLTIINLDRIEAFKSRGITREKVMRAMADKIGVVWNEKNSLKIEEQLAYDFERYVGEKNGEKPEGIIKQFFEVLKKLIEQFVQAYIKTDGNIIKDYYDVLHEGYSVASEVTRLENEGVINSFVKDGVLDAYALGRIARSKEEDVAFKLSEERDAYTQKLKKVYNDTSEKVSKLEEKTEQDRIALTKTLIEKANTARVVDTTEEGVKKLSRFTNRTKKPVGKLTERGLKEVETLEFENPEVAQKEVIDYLTNKQKLIETRRQLQVIRRDLQNAKTGTKEGKATLRDVERRLRLRRRLLEQKDFYVDMGMKRGAKEQMNMIRKRGIVLRNTQDMIGISDERAKKIIAGRRVHTMSEKEFNDFMQEFVGKAQDIRATLDARDEVKSIIQSEQLNKVDNLIRALELPTIDKMTQEQATAFASILYQYQFGDTFLTKRELETSIRTKYGEIRTERELLQKIEEITGISTNELRAIEGKGSDIYKNWFQLSKKNPFYSWLVGQKMLAKTKEISQVYKFRQTLDSLVRKARASRKSGSVAESIWDAVAPTDKEVFEALDTGDFSKLTPEEKVLADFLTIMFRTKYDKLKENFKDFKGRENYVTHMARTFMETLKDTGSLKEAYTSFMNDQKETENAVEILASQTGEILAFDKFLPYMLRRSGQLVPSKNVSRIALTYFTATTRKELLDEFIPEAMLTLHGYKMITGQTEKGLDLKPALEQFTKQYLNDAKGRKIEFITRQGSFSDNLIAGFTAWISAKYIGGNPVLAFFNLFGDLLALSAGTTNKQKLNSFVRAFQKSDVSEAVRGIIGQSPLQEITSTQGGIQSKILPFWFSLMSGTSYLANQLTVRGMLTQEEFKTGVVSDKRIQEIAEQINKFKLTDSYGRSLVGNTTAGKASTQFKTWAVPFLITTMEHFNDLVKNFAKSASGTIKEKKLVNSFVPENKQQAIELGRIVLTGAIMYATVQALKGAFEDGDEQDDYLWRQINNNLNTIYGILAMPFDKTALVPVVIGEVNKVQDLLKQLWTMEEYKRPTETNFTGDLKALKTFKDIVTPVGATRIFKLKKEEGTPRERLINEAIKTGEFDAEAIAIKTTEEWSSKSPETRENTINNINQAYRALKKYPESEVVSIALGENNNKEKVTMLINYAEKVGVDQAYAEVKEIMKDRELYANQKKKTGALISAQLFRDFQVEVKKLKTSQ